jgi:hypothetical protein
MELTVNCYAGHRGEQTPRQIQFGKRKIEVVEIVDQWLSPDHRYFKLIADDQGLYIIRHDEREQKWELTFFKQLDTDRNDS